jgi:DHA1 family tetracycline resistance protein-like MFS transporter
VKRPLVVVLAAIGLDAIGIGLIFPILPRLLENLTHSHDVAPYIGITTALYAVMQFIFAPVLGALSDNVGRRPVLLLSLAGAAISYVLMAFATQLWMLVLGRAIAGLTSANVSVATAYITDISPEGQRARRFGLLNATFGVGFIVGPVLGGVLGDYGLRLPFFAAGALNAGNLLVAWFVLPESRKGARKAINLAALNPLRPLRWVFSRKDLLPITSVFFILSAAGEVYGTCWALWGTDTFHWNGRWIGLSLGTFGVCQVLVQALLPGPATRWLGERGAVLGGMACTCVALVVLAFAAQGWIVFAIMPVFALGGIGTPALQARATGKVDGTLQGQLQGVLASAVSLASIVAPIAFSTIYFVVRNEWPGAIWLSVVVTNLIAVPLVVLGTRTVRAAPPASATSARPAGHALE